MRNLTHVAALAVFVVLMPSAFAQQQPAAPPAPGAQPSQAAPTPAEVDAQIAKMQELMNQMNQQMAEIQKTTDPKQRQELMQQHWATMQSAMTLMQGAFGGHMMGGRMMMGPMMMWGDYRNLTPEQLKQRQYMMDHWMPMQQMMMGHMMQFQGMMMQPPASPPAK